MKKDNGVSFIDVKVTYKHDKFTTSFYHKPTVSRRHTHFTVFYHPHTKCAWFIYCYVNVSGFAQTGLGFI